MRGSIRFIFRGEAHELSAFEPSLTLLEWLRTRARCHGVKEGCAEGDCGACTVVLARPVGDRVVYTPVNSCVLTLGQAHGAEIVTVEDLADAGTPHPVQAAMVAHHASQCGFCTPGIVMSLFAFYQRSRGPAERGAILDQLAGNLCRCTGYRPIVEAALAACAAPADDTFARSAAESASRLAAIEDRDDILVGDEAAAFFAAPASEASLADIFVRHPDARVVGGATDVGLWITKALRDIGKILWIGRVDGFNVVRDGLDGLELMAGATLADAWPALARLHPDIGELIRRFGSVQIRASGTVGGNICNGSPIGDLAPVLIALGAELELRREAATRALPVEDFFIAYGKQDRAAGEYLRAIRVPRLAGDEAFRCYKISKRFDEDISTVSAAFKFTLDGRRVASARLAFGGIAGTPSRARAAERACVGIDLDDASSAGAALAALGGDFKPIDDARASAAYRSLVARNLLRRALMELAGAHEPTRLSMAEAAHVG